MHGSDVHPSRSTLTEIRAILLDIEGTTTPIEFVHDVLFPHARARLADYLERHAADPEVRADLEQLRAEYDAETVESSSALPPWDPGAYLVWLMDRDRKSRALKSIQGRIWHDGYRAGELRGAVYRDVAPALRRWRREGREIAIFSSGSVQAQRDLFANTQAGDLSSFLSGYFDTTTGPKRDPESYRRIAAALRRAAGEILFVSDVPEELDAARHAGMPTSLCVRDPRSRVQASDHPRVQSFDELLR